jgi:hypothetical protein
MKVTWRKVLLALKRAGKPTIPKAARRKYLDLAAFRLRAFYKDKAIAKLKLP